MRRLIPTLLIALSAFALTAASPRPRANGTYQLVQSIPQGTGLEQPDLQFAGPTWVSMIDQARESIDFGEFYIANEQGQALEPVFAAMDRAGARGVKMRFIVSKEMIKNDQAAFSRVKGMRNLELRVINFGAIPGAGGILHAKYFIVDRANVYIGSQNFDWRSLSQIHELGVKAQDPALAAQVESVFEMDWKLANGAAPEAARPAPRATRAGGVELLVSPVALVPNGLRAAIPVLIDLIRSARKSIKIQALDYSVSAKGGKWTELDDALRAAAGRGVSVEMIVSNWNTRPPGVDHVKSLAAVPGIEVRFATIPQPASGFVPYGRVVHSKYIVVDGAKLWVGTSNWSRDYFYSSRNLELLMTDPSLVAQGDRIFETLWSSQFVDAVDPNKTYQPFDPGKP